MQDRRKRMVKDRNNIAHISAPSRELNLQVQYHERGHYYFGLISICNLLDKSECNLLDKSDVAL